MKNEILYNYNINVEEIMAVDTGYQFYVDYEKYILYKTIRSEKTIKEINNYLNRTINRFFKIIPTINGELACKVNDITYALIKITMPSNNEIDISDIINSYIIVNDQLNDLNRTNWDMLWSSKVDYLEYQVSELATDHPTVKNSFSYYVGLAENAIEYFNAIKKDNLELVLSQKRIKFPNIAIDYYNPLNLVVDYKVRNIAEYIKTYFFNQNAERDLNSIIHYNYNFTSSEYNLLFARLLFPSYYFDELTEVLEHKKNEDCLLRYIDLTSEYELFLKKSLEFFSKRAEMIKIDWLL